MKLGKFLLLFITLFSCYRDNLCYCAKKNGCKIILVLVYDSITYVGDKIKYCPKFNYDIDTGHYVILDSLSQKFDKLNINYDIGVIDSFNIDTIWNINGIDTRDYKLKGYSCLCYY